MVRDLDPRPVGPETRLADLALDSLARLTLELRIDEVFGAPLMDDDLASASTIADLAARIEMRRGREVKRSDAAWALTPPARVLREVLDRTLTWIPTILARAKIEGSDNLAGLRGPMLVCPNHTSHLDAPLVRHALPAALRVAPRSPPQQTTGSRDRSWARSWLSFRGPFPSGARPRSEPRCDTSRNSFSRAGPWSCSPKALVPRTAASARCTMASDFLPPPRESPWCRSGSMARTGPAQGPDAAAPQARRAHRRPLRGSAPLRSFGTARRGRSRHRREHRVPVRGSVDRTHQPVTPGPASAASPPGRRSGIPPGTLLRRSSGRPRGCPRRPGNPPRSGCRLRPPRGAVARCGSVGTGPSRPSRASTPRSYHRPPW